MFGFQNQMAKRGGGKVKDSRPRAHLLAYLLIFAGPGELYDDLGRGERLPAAVGHLRRPPQGPQVRLRALRRRPHVLRHRPTELAGELPRHVVPAGLNPRARNDL